MASFEARSLVAVTLFQLAIGCTAVDVDPGERTLPPLDGPTAELDPSAKVIPFPNDLLIDPSTGNVDLPAPCDESDVQRQIRTGVLNTLDGFGTFEPALQTTFTESVDENSLDGRVMLLARTINGVPVDPADAQPVPVEVMTSETQRATADCSAAETVTSLTIVPLAPLAERSTYDVVLTDGITTTDNVPFVPSVTWALIRQSVDPVTVEDGKIVDERTPLDPVADADQLLGIDQLWKAHAEALTFVDGALGLDRSQLLLAWEFHTQTTIDPLDASVAGSLPNAWPAQPLQAVASITGEATAPEFLAGVLGSDTCDLVGCEAVGAVLGGAVLSHNYQTDAVNPLPGGAPVPGPWSDPVHPILQQELPLPFLAFVPASPAPQGGYPVVVFGHGLTRSRNDLFAIGPQLAAAGFASIAIDWVDHGDRAVRISDDATIGCAGSPAPTDSPQCFAPIVSSDLAATRDNLRQSALDAMTLVRSLQACSADGCGPLSVDPEHIGYLGQSLGSLLGTVVAAASPEIRASVIDVGGVGWVDVLEHTASLGIRCPVIDSLIAAGVIDGAPSDLTASPPTGTCVSDSWRNDPGWQTFANIARWVLDPTDGANFASSTDGRAVLIQEVVGDLVVPNVATEDYARLLDAPAYVAAHSLSPDTVSKAITGNTDRRKLVRYLTLPADAATRFPGNTYAHGSLLAPADSNSDGLLGTALLQRDAITFLGMNLKQLKEVAR